MDLVLFWLTSENKKNGKSTSVSSKHKDIDTSGFASVCTQGSSSLHGIYFFFGVNKALKESYLQLTRSVSGKRALSGMILMIELKEFKKKPVIFALLSPGTGGNLPSQLFSTK